MATERIVYMASQIARNFAALGEDKAAELTAQHIRDFWPPAMRTTLLESNLSALPNAVREAVHLLNS